AVIGDHEDAVSTVRSLLLQLTTHHSPDEVMVAAAFGPEQTEAWRGVDLLPHAQDAELVDGPVPARRVTTDAHSLGQVLGQTLTDRLQYMHSLRRGGVAVAAPPHLVVVLDSHGERATSLPLTAAPAELGITVIHVLSERLHEPDDVDARLTLDPTGEGQVDTDQLETAPGTSEAMTVDLRADRVPASLLESTTRAMAPLRVSLTQARAEDGEQTLEIA